MKGELLWLLAVVAVLAAFLVFRYRSRRPRRAVRPAGNGKGKVIPFPRTPWERARLRRSS